MPLRTLVPPLYVLAPLPSVRVPEPAMAKPPVPSIVPFRKRLPAPFTVRLLESVTGVPRVTLFAEFVTICGVVPLEDDLEIQPVAAESIGGIAGVEDRLVQRESAADVIGHRGVRRAPNSQLTVF